MKALHSAWLDTACGSMLAVADETALFLLEFSNRRGLPYELERLQKMTQLEISSGKTAPIDSIEQELQLYFQGHLTVFQTPIKILGTPFQQQVWAALQKIPYGKTCSYAELAQSIQKPSAFRAVANANGANQLAILIPCHRVICSNGTLGGYGGGLHNKQHLLSLEKTLSKKELVNSTWIPYNT